MKLYPNISIYFLIWFFSLIFIFLFGLTNFAQGKNIGKNLVENLSNWDGKHYLSIAKKGYQEKFQYAFFPVYPLSIRLASEVTGNFLFAALAVSIISTFFALHLLFNLISLDFGNKVGEKTLIFLLIFPTSFYLITAYSEGLFLFLTLAAFYFFRKNNLFLAIFFAALVSATRITGLAVSLALIAQVISQTGINKKNWFILFSPLGFILYCIFLWQNTGDPFYFLTAESAHWQRSLAVPGLSFWESLKGLSQQAFIGFNFNSLLEILFAVFGLGMVFRSLRFLPSTYSIYGLISILFPLATSTLLSIPRFLLPIFPIFILLAIGEDTKVIFLTKLLSILLLSGFSILFINGYWIS